MNLAYATILAEELLAQLTPYCTRIQIAGSIRRRKHFPKDIEIVCIPKSEPVKDMFGIEIGRERNAEFIRIVNSMEKIKGEPTGKYTQRIFKGQTVDLFMCEKETWSSTIVIRTGDAKFSHKLMIAANKRGFEQKDGYLTRDGHIIPLYEEKDYFDALGLPYLEPWERNEEAYRKKPVER